jgi:hypothetical protein
MLENFAMEEKVTKLYLEKDKFHEEFHNYLVLLLEYCEFTEAHDRLLKHNCTRDNFSYDKYIYILFQSDIKFLQSFSVIPASINCLV